VDPKAWGRAGELVWSPLVSEDGVLCRITDWPHPGSYPGGGDRPQELTAITFCFCLDLGSELWVGNWFATHILQLKKQEWGAKSDLSRNKGEPRLRLKSTLCQSFSKLSTLHCTTLPSSTCLETKELVACLLLPSRSSAPP
jgi:hypothetical protein